MSKYEVQIPIAGYFEATVEAENEDGAIQAAWDQIDLADDADILAQITFEYLNQITTGNVLHAQLNEIAVEKVGE